ncbi:DNA-directed RNA polymerase I subunit RPA1, partial [Hyalella azteca]|uniref:DNA-directed RNA polymerase n=1 Tax=Hyalella azteca TaxID=294128 RepID=A0A8B7N8L3_HYAAZ
MEDVAPYTEIDRLDLRMYSDEEIEKISVMQVTSEESINNMGHCCKGGLYDQRMGVMMRISTGVCETCHLNAEKCMGHCGHIDMPVPVYNPVFLTHLYKLLRIVCFGCGSIPANSMDVLQLQYQLKLLSEGYSHEALGVCQIVSEVREDEIQVDADGKETKATGAAVTMLMSLKAKLDAYYESVSARAADEGSRVYTSTVRSVRDECVKSFISSLKPRRFCPNCKYPSFSVIYRMSQMIVAPKATHAGKGKRDDAVVSGILDLDLSRQSVLTPLQARQLLREAWKSDSMTLSQIFPVLNNSPTKHPTDLFFISKLLVIPPKYRPLVRMGDLFLEHDSVVLLKNVLRLCRCMTF